MGYLAAGIVLGPFTPGFVADGALAAQLAEIGVMLLMFGVGLHFSLDDLMAVLALDPKPYWHDQQWAAKALAALPLAQVAAPVGVQTHVPSMRPQK